MNSLVARYRSRGILVDTSLLLLLYVGLYDREQVERFRRTRQEFRIEDFEFVLEFVDQFRRVVTTPHILTEVSNFLGQLHGDLMYGCRAVFAQHIAAATTYEHRPPAEELTANEGFATFGITDTSIMEVAAEPYLVLTTDYALAGYLVNKGIAALNYNYIRPL